MNKQLLKEMTGTIINIFIPEVYKKDGFIDEQKVNIIALEISTNDGLIKIIKPRDSEYSSLFVKDIVRIKKYALEYDYKNYLEQIKKEIDDHYSQYNEDYKTSCYKKYYCTKEQFDNKPQSIVTYEIDFN